MLGFMIIVFADEDFRSWDDECRTYTHSMNTWLLIHWDIVLHITTSPSDSHSLAVFEPFNFSCWFDCRLPNWKRWFMQKNWCPQPANFMHFSTALTIALSLSCIKATLGVTLISWLSVMCKNAECSSSVFPDLLHLTITLPHSLSLHEVRFADQKRCATFLGKW